MSRIVVVGDSLLDVDLVGRVERFCPDAPVPVVDQVAERPRPGGAALAALLAAGDGHDVTLVTPLAADEAGERLRDLLADQLTLASLRHAGATPVKRRVRVGGQSLVRLDTGGQPGRIGELTPEVAAALERADAILVSDYGRGLSGHAELRRRLAEQAPGTPIVWDPHPRGATPVAGARLATPNAAEAQRFAASLNGHGGGHELAAVSAWASALVAAWRVGAVAVTMAQHGALLSYGRGAPVVFPAPQVSVRDTCGAGDRFAVAATARLGAGCASSETTHFRPGNGRVISQDAVAVEAVQAAVDCASAFVADGAAAALTADPGGGPVALTGHPGPDGNGRRLEDLLRQVRARHGTVVATGGCFDLLHAGHVASLRAARQLGDCLVVCLNSDASVRRLKGPGRPLAPAADRARVLNALECVDAVVVFDENTPAQVLRHVRPDIWAKGGDYAGDELPEAEVLREWGGQAVVLPYVPGRSTTTLVRTAREAGVT